ncbi:MAG: glycosyltransferase family 39 protein [Cyanobacteria bacterium J06597_16]
MHKRAKFLFSIVIVLGIFFRVINIDQKIFTGDECITQVRAAGYKGESYGVDAYKGASVAKLLPRDQLVTAKDISRFQNIQAQPSPLDTLRVTATGAPQHPPLYWLLVRFWMQVFGNSVAAARSLSVIFSILTLPALYWMCWELFGSAVPSWIAVALVSVSPVHIFQAHNARPYSLWILMIVISSATLLRAMKGPQNRPKTWIAYGIALSLSLYTYLFSLFILIAHGIYVLCEEGFSNTQKLKNYLLTSGWVLLSFSPWIAVVLFNFNTANTMTAWTGTPVDSLTDLIWSYVKNLQEIFLFWNIHFDPLTPLTESSAVFFLGTALTLFISYAFYFLWRNSTRTDSTRKEWVFLFALTGVTVLTLMAADFVLGGRRAALGRYLYPSMLGIQITVAYLLGITFKRSTTWRVVVVTLLSCGILSSAASVQTQTWRGHPDFALQSAQLINQAERPLVISDNDIVFGLMPLNTQLSSDVNWILVSKFDSITIPNQFSDIFLYEASTELQDYLKTKYEFEAVYKYPYPGSFIWPEPPPSILWQLKT